SHYLSQSVSIFLSLDAYHCNILSIPTRRSSDLASPRAPPKPRVPRRSTERNSQAHALLAHQPDDCVDHPKALPIRPLTHKREVQDRKSTRLNSSHVKISYAVFCLKKKKSILFIN